MKRELSEFALRVAVVLTLALTAGDASLQGPLTTEVRLAWDANDDPEVIGYLVHVITRSGHDTSTQTYDVGDVTEFTFSNAIAGQRYYFAVAAYAEGPLVGPRSEEISTIAGSSMPSNSLPRSRWSPMAMSTSRTIPRARGLRNVTALTATGDGRLLVAEEEQRVRVVDTTGVVAEPALRADRDATRFTDIVMDPAFERTHNVFVGVTEAIRGEIREFSIVRYRELNNILGEAAVVVTGLSLTSAAEPRFAVDDVGRIYVAMPAVRANRSDPYAGKVLRFNGDGTVPADSRAFSPIFAEGYAVPAALEWDGADLWLVSGDMTLPHAFARLSPDPSAHMGPKRPIAQQIASIGAAVALPLKDVAIRRRKNRSDAAVSLVLIDAAQRLHKMAFPSRDGAGELASVDWAYEDKPVAIVAGPHEELFVAVQSPGGTFAIFEIRQ